MGAERNSHFREKNRLPGRSFDAALQYGAICLRFSPGSECAVEVLLITSRDTGRWVIPKGWGMAKKTSFEVTKEEAWQEAGVKGRIWKSLSAPTSMARCWTMAKSSRRRYAFISFLSPGPRRAFLRKGREH